jgi:iron(III) transport system permease protein
MTPASITPDWMQREGHGIMAFIVFCAVVLALFPALRLLAAALAPGWSWNPAALASLGSPHARLATWNTIETGVLAGIGSLALGTTFALTLSVTNIRAKMPLAFLFALSLMVSPQVVALAFKALAGPASPLLNALGIAPPPGSPNPMLGRGGVIFVMALHHAPLVAITLSAGLQAIPRTLVEAAYLDGATPWLTVRRVILPLLRPHLLAASLLVFVAGVGNFGIPALLGLPAGYLTLPTLIYRQLSSSGPAVIADAAALSLLVGAIAGAGVLLLGWLQGHREDRLDSDSVMQPFWHLGRRRRRIVEAALWTVIFVACLLPTLSLLASSLVPTVGVRLSLATATLSNYAEVLFRQALTVRAFRNSLGFAATTAIVLGLLAPLIAYGIERYAGRWRATLEAIIEIPYALPGVVLGIACILLFLKPLPLIGISIYATPLIIVFAYLARFLPLALKAPLAAMRTLPRDQEEAAAVFGASAWQRLRYVVLPHLAASAVAGGLLVFLLSFNELTVSALLWSGGTETLGVALLSLEEQGLSSAASAIALLATTAVAGIMLVLHTLRHHLAPGVLPWTDAAD